MKKTAIGLATALVPGIASAHPDHLSGGEFGLTHLLTDPFHLALTGGAVLLFVVLRRLATRRTR